MFVRYFTIVNQDVMHKSIVPLCREIIIGAIFFYRTYDKILSPVRYWILASVCHHGCDQLNDGVGGNYLMHIFKVWASPLGSVTAAMYVPAASELRLMVAYPALRLMLLRRY